MNCDKTYIGRLAIGIAAFSLGAGCMAPTATRTSTGHVGGATLTAVYSRASQDYVRSQKPDGTFQTETYAFKEGGNFGGPRVDETIDRLTFADISRVIAAPLAAQNYVQSNEPADTDLLIVVYWGTTIVPNDVMPLGTRASDMMREKAAANGGVDPGEGAQYMQDTEEFSYLEAIKDGQIDARSANILGYTDEIFRTKNTDPYLMTLRDEVEHDRYYVVLLAYDYQAGRRHNVKKLLWETRFSIPETGNDFEKAFPLMASIAGKYFGQDSHGLIHHNLADTHVYIGETKSLGTVPEK